MNAWDDLISEMPGAHILQTSIWANIKAPNGWQPFYLYWDKHGNWKAARLPDAIPTESFQETRRNDIIATALVLQRSIQLGGFSAPLRVLYVPKGPLLDWSQQSIRKAVFSGLKRFARQQGAIFIKMDPDVWIGKGLPGSPDDHLDPVGLAVMEDLKTTGWRFSDEQIQFRNTVMIDLNADEDTLLARMKQKTRYNIRLAARKGVAVRRVIVEDLDTLYQMYAETAVRDGFVIRDGGYYRTAWKAFLDAGIARALIAEVENEPVAAVFTVVFAERAWYLYGMSRDCSRERMPNYLLQWEAIRLAKQAGCRWFDLWGAPDDFMDTDPLWGVYRFKEGLGGIVWRGIGAWDLPIQPWIYRLYREILPRWLERLRKHGNERTRQTLSME